MSIDVGSLERGQVVGEKVIEIDRSGLVAYADASGDQNPIHQDEEFARSVGLPGVIAHGMFTMGAAVDVVAQWAGGPQRIVDYAVRFSRPVPVPAARPATINVVATVGAIDTGTQRARIDLAVTCDGAKVLARAQAFVQL